MGCLICFFLSLCDHRFLRREKEIAEAKLQVVDTECIRVKQRFAHLEKQLEETNKVLSEERKNTQVKNGVSEVEHGSCLEQLCKHFYM